MNKEQVMENRDWEAERTRRLRYVRKCRIKDTLRSCRIEIAIMFAVVVGFFTFMYFWNKYQPLRERAAYLEGRWGVSPATAVAMAEQEVR